MSIPLLEYAPNSQNHRVDGFEIPGDEQPSRYSTEQLLSSGDMDDLIASAYRQICNEQQMLLHYRQRFLESQLRSGQLTVKEFVRGLVLSDSFRKLTFESNNNYRFVEICVQRILGRSIYGEREKFAWSVVLATKGLEGFVDALLDSDEYLENFGDHTVPYQRRRILPQHDQGETTFNHMARYGADYRDKLPISAASRAASRLSYTRWKWQKTPPKVLVWVWTALFFSGSAFIIALFATILLGL